MVSVARLFVSAFVVAATADEKTNVVRRVKVMTTAKGQLVQSADETLAEGVFAIDVGRNLAASSTHRDALRRSLDEIDGDAISRQKCNIGAGRMYADRSDVILPANLDVDSAQECAILCAMDGLSETKEKDNEGCKSYTYNKLTRQCYFQDSATPSLKKHNCCDAGLPCTLDGIRQDIQKAYHADVARARQAEKHMSEKLAQTQQLLTEERTKEHSMSIELAKASAQGKPVKLEKAHAHPTQVKESHENTAPLRSTKVDKTHHAPTHKTVAPGVQRQPVELKAAHEHRAAPVAAAKVKPAHATSAKVGGEYVVPAKVKKTRQHVLKAPAAKRKKAAVITKIPKRAQKKNSAHDVEKKVGPAKAKKQYVEAKKVHTAPKTQAKPVGHVKKEPVVTSKRIEAPMVKASKWLKPRRIKNRVKRAKGKKRAHVVKNKVGPAKAKPVELKKTQKQHVGVKTAPTATSSPKKIQKQVKAKKAHSATVNTNKAKTSRLKPPSNGKKTHVGKPAHVGKHVVPAQAKPVDLTKAAHHGEASAKKAKRTQPKHQAHVMKVVPAHAGVAAKSKVAAPLSAKQLKKTQPKHQAHVMKAAPAHADVVVKSKDISQAASPPHAFAPFDPMPAFAPVSNMTSKVDPVKDMEQREMKLHTVALVGACAVTIAVCLVGILAGAFAFFMEPEKAAALKMRLVGKFRAQSENVAS